MALWTAVQKELIERPFSGSIFIEGPAGAGKTSAAVARLERMLQQGIHGSSILILVPQRTLAGPYEQAIYKPGLSTGSLVSILTIGGLARRMVDLFWPLINDKAGFSLAVPASDQLPTFLTLETAQYFMAHSVGAIIDEQGLFNSVSISRHRLYSQVLDDLNKAAAVGFYHKEIGERLKSAWSGEAVQARIYDDVQICASHFRQYCLEHNLLDFSLQLEIFRDYLWPAVECRNYLQQTYRHLISDNIEEDIPIAHDILRAWLPSFDSALLIFDIEGGYRSFLGADPASAYSLKGLCETQRTFSGSHVMSPAIESLQVSLCNSIEGGKHTSWLDWLKTSSASHEKSVEYTVTGNEPSQALHFKYHRFFPEILDWVTQQVASQVFDQGLPPGEIVILAPFLSDSLRFALQTHLAVAGIPMRTHRPSRSLIDEPAIRCLLTLSKIAFPEWGIHAAKVDVTFALMQAIHGLDLVRAHHLVGIVYRQSADPPILSSFNKINLKEAERITFRLGERFERLRTWLSDEIEKESEFDHFLSRLFGEVLSQPGYGFHADFDAGQAAANLIESVRKFRQEVGPTLRESGTPLGREYLMLVTQGVISAQYLGSWRPVQQDAVLLSPAYTFLMSNQPVEIQFWLDIGSHGWSQRLYQPLTHPYVLTRGWEVGRKWSDLDEVEANRTALERLTAGLLRRCKGRLYLGLSELNEQGYEQRGPLLTAFQRVLRDQAFENTGNER